MTNNETEALDLLRLICGRATSPERLPSDLMVCRVPAKLIERARARLIMIAADNHYRTGVEASE